MRKYFNLVMAFVATLTLASSCEKEPIEEPVPDNTVNFTATTFTGAHAIYGSRNSYIISLADDGRLHAYGFSLNGAAGEIDDNGNITIPSGTYTNSEEDGDNTIDGLAFYADASEGPENTKYDYGETVNAVVTENKIVVTAIIGGVTHVVTYNGTLSMPAELPEPDVEFEATYAQAAYSGNTVNGEGKFKLFLSDVGLDENNAARPNSIYYRLTLSTEKLDPNAEIAIPAGRYEVSNSESGVGYATDVIRYTYGETLTDTEEYDYFSGGYLTVNEDGSIEAKLTLYFGGSSHIVTFSGEVEILENTMPQERPYSTIESDIVCDLSDHSLSIYQMEDIYDSGYQNYLVGINPNNTTGDNIGFEILRGTDEDNVDLSGKYYINDSMNDYTAIPGYIDGFTLMGGWYYYEDHNSQITESAPFAKGWIDVQVSDNGTYTITFDVYDDLDNHITGTHTYVEATGASCLSSAPRPVVSL